jgi:hypothetical protein
MGRRQQTKRRLGIDFRNEPEQSVIDDFYGLEHTSIDLPEPQFLIVKRMIKEPTRRVLMHSLAPYFTRKDKFSTDDHPGVSIFNNIDALSLAEKKNVQHQDLRVTLSELTEGLKEVDDCELTSSMMLGNRSKYVALGFDSETRQQLIEERNGLLRSLGTTMIGSLPHISVARSSARGQYANQICIAINEDILPQTVSLSKPVVTSFIPRWLRP